MATEEWHPDINVTIDIAKRCIEEQFHSLVPIDSIKFVGEGWDNKVFLINNKFIFRFPHRKIAIELIESENIILNHIYSKITLEIPRPTFIGSPTEYYPSIFHGYPMLVGTPGYQAKLSEQQRINSIVPLAIFLKQLHSFTEAKAIEVGAKKQVFDRTDAVMLTAELTNRVNKMSKQKIVDINTDCFQSEISQTLEVKLSMEHKVLVHGDLYSRHLLYNQHKLTGIIDWGDVGINHCVVDLAVVFSFYPEHCHQEFFKIYGKVAAEIISYARFLGLYSALTIMLYGHNTGDKMLVSEGYDAVQRINPDIFKGSI